MRVCTKCNQDKPIGEFYVGNYRCKICSAAISRARYANHTPEQRARNNKRVNTYIRKKRREVIDHYGAACVCCGETEYVFLAIDHINGDGQVDRNSMSTTQFITWIRKNNYPDTLRILCMNCNQATRYNLTCPHQL